MAQVVAGLPGRILRAIGWPSPNSLASDSFCDGGWVFGRVVRGSSDVVERFPSKMGIAALAGSAVGWLWRRPCSRSPVFSFSLRLVKAVFFEEV